MLSAFLAALTASHLCFLADRVVAHRSVRGSSGCDGCGRELKLGEVLPVLPWVLSRGRSRCCGSPLRVRYPLSEGVVGAWGAAWAVLATLGAVGWLLVVAMVLTGAGVAGTRSYRAGMRRAGMSCELHDEMQQGSHGVHQYFGALRCGWCASVVGAGEDALLSR